MRLIAAGCGRVRPSAAECCRWRSYVHSQRSNHVLTVGSQVLSGEIDVAATLRAIPADRVRQMQESISMHANRMHYGMGDTPGDALELLLRALDEAASQPLPARLQASLERANRHSACADAYPEQMRRTTLRAWKTLEAHELWKTAPRSCAELVGGTQGAAPGGTGVAPVASPRACMVLGMARGAATARCLHARTHCSCATFACARAAVAPTTPCGETRRLRFRKKEFSSSIQRYSYTRFSYQIALT